MERRWGKRFLLDQTVLVVRNHDAVGFACLREVSLSGAFLKTRWPLPTLTRIHLEIHEGADDWGTKNLVEAYVARHCSEGLGLEWCEFAPGCIVSLIAARQRHDVPLPLRDAELAPKRHIP